MGKGQVMWEGLSKGRHGSRRRCGLMLFVVWATAIPVSLLSFVFVGGMTARVAHAQSLGFTEFPITSGYVRPQGIVTGPDGNLWFSETTGPNIGKITSSGTITEYPIPSNGSFVQTPDITVGPDSNLWFDDWGNNAIGKMTTLGAVTEYSIPTTGAGPTGIVTGSDGNLWFTESNTDKIGRVTPTGTVTEFSISSGSGVSLIASGPDHNLWFTETSLNKIGRLTTSGTLTEFSTASGSQPYGIIGGPDGNVWFTESGTSKIGKISTSGSVLAEYATSTSGANLQYITVGPDGKLWFAEYSGNAIGSVTTSGTVNEYPTGTSSKPVGITAGPDGNIWYSGYAGPSIGTFSLNACASLADSVSRSPVGPAQSETVNATLTSCGVATLSNASTTTTTAVPSGCPAAPAIPSFTSTLTYGQADAHNTTFAAPSCPGTYTLTSTTKVGSKVMATGGTTYLVVAVGDGVLYPTSSRPAWVTTGSDGNLWYTDSSGCGQFGSGLNLVQVTPEGSATCFDFQPGQYQQITTGADGNLYVVVNNTHIAQVNPSNASALNWEVPVSGTVNDIAPGPDGNVWFVTQTGSSATVGFVTPGAKFKQIGLPVGSGVPQAITTGSDGALWFPLAGSGGKIGRMTTAGALTFFTVPGVGTGGSPDFGGGGTITPGPDGNVWFTAGSSTSGDLVGSISPTGAIRTFHPPTANVNAGAITTGADGNLWFNEPRLNGDVGVGRVTPAGIFTDFQPTNDFNPIWNIVAGPDGNVWNGAYYGGGLELIEIAAPSTCTPLAATAMPPSVVHGATETVTATIANCANTPHLMKLVNKLVRPSACGAAITTTTHVPLQPYVQTVVTNASKAPTCKGTYTDKLTLSSGGTVIASKSVTYKVT